MKTKIAILVIAVIVVLTVWCTTEFHWGHDVAWPSQEVSVSESFINSDNTRTYNSYAIVSTPIGWWEGQLQRALVSRLAVSLANTGLAFTIKVWDSGTSTSARPMKFLGVFQSEKEAQKVSPELIITVSTKRWRFNPMPFHGSWDEDICVKAKPCASESPTHESAASVQKLGYTFEYRGRNKATTSGLYSPKYVINSRATGIASSVMESFEGLVRQVAEEQTREKLKRREEHRLDGEVSN